MFDGAQDLVFSIILSLGGIFKILYQIHGPFFFAFRKQKTYPINKRIIGELIEWNGIVQPGYPKHPRMLRLTPHYQHKGSVHFSANKLCHVYEGLWPRCACKKCWEEKYLAGVFCAEGYFIFQNPDIILSTKIG